MRGVGKNFSYFDIDIEHPELFIIPDGGYVSPQGIHQRAVYYGKRILIINGLGSIRAKIVANNAEDCIPVSRITRLKLKRHLR